MHRVSCWCCRKRFCNTPSNPCALEKKVVVERSDEKSGGVPKQLAIRDDGMSDEELGTEAYIEDEAVEVVGGAPALAISGFGSEGFSFSEIVRRKMTGGTDFV